MGNDLVLREIWSVGYTTERMSERYAQYSNQSLADVMRGRVVCESFVQKKIEGGTNWISYRMIFRLSFDSSSFKKFVQTSCIAAFSVRPSISHPSFSKN